MTRILLPIFACFFFLTPGLQAQLIGVPPGYVTRLNLEACQHDPNATFIDTIGTRIVNEDVAIGPNGELFLVTLLLDDHHLILGSYDVRQNVFVVTIRYIPFTQSMAPLIALGNTTEGNLLTNTDDPSVLQEINPYSKSVVRTYVTEELPRNHFYFDLFELDNSIFAISGPQIGPRNLKVINYSDEGNVETITYDDPGAYMAAIADFWNPDCTARGRSLPWPIPSFRP